MATQIEKESNKHGSINLFRKQINPEFKAFVKKKISEIERIFNEFLTSISGKKIEVIYKNKIEAILKDISSITTKFLVYAAKFKYYTEENERSLRKFGFLIGELEEELKFNKDAFDKELNEIYLLNIVNKWSNFNSAIKELFYNIEHSHYPYVIHTIFSLAFVFIPFLNIFSLVGGIYLITHKDYRALTFGAIILSLYFIQLINIISLAVFG